jgi:hypothetical protein
MPPFMWQQSTPFGAMPLLPGMSGLPGVLNGVVLSPEDSGSGAALFRDATSMPWDWFMTESLGPGALEHSLSWPHAPQHVAQRLIWQLTLESPPLPCCAGMLGSLPTAFMQRNDSSNSGLSVHHQHGHHHRRTPPPQVHCHGRPPSPSCCPRDGRACWRIESGLRRR